MKIIIFLLFLASSCGSKSGINEKDRMADQLILDFAHKVECKGVYPSGIGGGIDHETGKHKLFSITFEVNEELKDLQEARKLLVTTISELIEFINSREDIQEFIYNVPVTIENVDVSIIRRFAKPGKIVSMFNCGNKLYYFAQNNPNEVRWKEICDETFEEAQKKLVEHQ